MTNRPIDRRLIDVAAGEPRARGERREVRKDTGGAAAEVQNRVDLVERAIRRGKCISQLGGGKPTAFDESGDARCTDAGAQASRRQRYGCSCAGPAPNNGAQRLLELARSLDGPANCESC